MELQKSFLTTIAATISLITLLFLSQLLIQKNTKNKKPPQAKGAWPIIGHLHLLGRSTLTHRVLGDMAETNGPMFTLKLGTHKVLVVSDAEIVKECLTTHDKVFASRPKSKAAEIMGYKYALVGLAPHGDYWRKVRKIITLEVLSQRRVDMLAHVRVSELRASLKDAYQSWVVNNKEMVKVEMSGWFGNMILNVVLMIIYGRRLPLNDKKGLRSQNAVRRFFVLLGTSVVSDFIPYTSFFDFGGLEKEMKTAAENMDNIIEGWLEEHKRDKESGQQNKQYFMDVLINILQDASQEDFDGLDHDMIIKASCQAILIASSDSMGATLTWALSSLVNNPKALKIAQDEIDEHVGRERPVEESDLKNLVYLDAIIKETLRLFTPGPLLIPHESVEDCIVSGYNIPKGTRLLINAWKMHRDPNIWSDPCEFKPERFLTSHKDIDVKGKHYELLPFGSGRRMCPGASFALPAMELTLASLIQHFELKRQSKEPIDMNERPGFTYIRATPLDVLLAPRLSSNMYEF